jgi:hypothetical protein
MCIFDAHQQMCRMTTLAFTRCHHASGLQTREGFVTAMGCPECADAFNAGVTIQEDCIAATSADACEAASPTAGSTAAPVKPAVPPPAVTMTPPTVDTAPPTGPTVTTMGPNAPVDTTGQTTVPAPQKVPASTTSAAGAVYTSGAIGIIVACLALAA